MNHHFLHRIAALAGALSLLLLTACGSSTEGQKGGLSAPQAGTVDSMIPAQTGVIPRDSFNLPYLGVTLTLPKDLQQAMTDQTLFMSVDEDLTDDGSAVEYALLTWDALTEAQRTETLEQVTQETYEAWVDTLSPVGALGIYDDAHAEELDELTGLTSHRHLGDAGDFHYYLSTDPSSPLSPTVAALGVRLYEASPLLNGDSSFALRKEAIRNLGDFTMVDLDGKAHTAQDLFAGNTLTMVNLFATWCSPCVKEIPELEKLRHNLADRGFDIVGVVLDGVDQMGNPDPGAAEKARELAEKTGAAYPFLIPDESLMNGRLIGIDAVPETFFVDSQGNIVGDIYPGAHSLSDWTEIVELELSRLKEAD